MAWILVSGPCSKFMLFLLNFLWWKLLTTVDPAGGTIVAAMDLLKDRGVENKQIKIVSPSTSVFLVCVWFDHHRGTWAWTAFKLDKSAWFNKVNPCHQGQGPASMYGNQSQTFFVFSEKKGGKSFMNSLYLAWWSWVFFFPSDIGRRRTTGPPEAQPAVSWVIRVSSSLSTFNEKSNAYPVSLAEYTFTLESSTRMSTRRGISFFYLKFMPNFQPSPY